MHGVCGMRTCVCTFVCVSECECVCVCVCARTKLACGIGRVRGRKWQSCLKTCHSYKKVQERAHYNRHCSGRILLPCRLPADQSGEI